MKKILFVVVISLAGLAVSAQNYETVKMMVQLMQYDKAKVDLDKAMANAKFAGKPEAYILKATTYGGLAMSDQRRNTPEGEQLANEANAAFAKFKEMDPSMSLLSDGSYQIGVDNLYRFNYNAGYNDYLAKKWDAAYGKLKKAVEYSDLMIDRKIIDIPIDTNLMILTGITAEKSTDSKPEAIKYYTRLADKKIKGEGFETVYQYLVNYYYQKKDFAAFEKYKALGAELYPATAYFAFDKIDFAVGLETNLNDKVKAIEEILAKDPNNYKANQSLAEVIYSAFYPSKDDKPEIFDSTAMEIKMIAAFKKAGGLQPDSVYAFLYLGDHLYGKSDQVNEQRIAHAADMKARTKPGTMASKEDVAKRDALDKKYGETLELAKEPYENVARIFGAKKNLDSREKQQYKKAVSYLGEIAAFKKVQAKNKKSPDAARYEAEEKKWTDLWESIK